MKFTVQLKDPDGFSECVDDAVKDSLKEIGLPKDEQDELLEIRSEKIWKVLSRWVGCQEYITIEFDTDAKTATVMPR